MPSVPQTFPVKVVRNVRIPMPDGLTLAADLHLPDTADLSRAAGLRWPAIIEYTPYHKLNNAVYGPRATRYPYFASHGDVFVNVDIRGTGDSEGHNDGPSSDAERADLLEVIRWCARQPWCDGQVAMIGISYTAGVCYDAARQAPEELKAVVLCQMCSDWYDGMACPGGTPRLFGLENFAPLMAAYNFAPPAAHLVGERWREIWAQRLAHSRPWSLAYVEHLLDGPYWQDRLLRDRHEDVRAAVMLIGGWCDWYGDDMLRTFARLRGPRRVIVGPWTHNYPENAWPLPRIDDRHECLRWFDRHLKGIDTDPLRPLDREPPVCVFVRGYAPPAPLRREDPGRFRPEDAWPPPAEPWRLRLGADGRLVSAGADAPASSAPAEDALPYRPDAGIAAGRYAIGQFLPGWGMPDDQRIDEGLSRVYTSSVLAQDTEVVGTPRLRLHYRAGARTAFLSAKLCDVAPDGTSVLVSRAVLNLTHLASHECPTALVPGQVRVLDVALQATAYRFGAGHRVRLMLAGADVLNAWPTPEPHVAALLRGQAHDTWLELPVAGASAHPEPAYRPSGFEPLPLAELPTPDYEVRRDLIGGTLTCSYRTQSGAGVNRSRYQVDLHHPAHAEVDSDFTYDIDRGDGWRCSVHARCITRSDTHGLDHEVHTRITVDGQPFWDRRWHTRVPRLGW